MFNDRDLALLGTGALLAVGCLLFPFPLAGKIVLGFGVLMGFMFAALLRVGPDRLPLEQWLLRRIRFHFQPRRYTYPQPFTTPVPHAPPPPASPESDLAPQPVSARPFAFPFHLAWDEGQGTSLVTALLVVVGADFLFWLGQGGAAELAALMALFFP